MRLVGLLTWKRNRYLVLQPVLLLFLMVGLPHAASTDSDRSDSTDSVLKINLKELESDSSGRGEFMVFLAHVSGTEDTGPGWGAAIAYDFVKFDPILFRIGLEATWSELNFALFQGTRFVSTSIEGSILFSGTMRQFRPYAGVGFSVYSNFWPDDEGPRNWIGPYDECSSCSFDYGSSIAGHVRVGAKLGVFGKVSMVADLKYTPSQPTTDVILVNELTGEEVPLNLKYDRQVLTSLLGISIRF